MSPSAIVLGPRAPALTAIYDQILAGAAATIDVANIPQTYRHLLGILSSGRGSATGAPIIGLRVNNDSGSSYDAHTWYGSAGSSNVSYNANQTSVAIGYLAGSDSTAGHIGDVMFEILDYASTTYHKLIRADSRLRWTTAEIQATMATGIWENTAAVNRLTLILSSGNFAAGARFTLYGF